MKTPELTQRDALIVVDVQNDFCPGGALAVDGGDEVVPVLNRWIDATTSAGALLVASRDWHPENHCSFEAQGGPWPPHCIRETKGAGYHPDLRRPAESLDLKKGRSPGQDAYSAFDNTGLAEELLARKIQRVWIGGLATDYCVRATAIDATREGLEVHVIGSAIRAVDLEPGDGERALTEMQEAGAIIEKPSK